MCVCGVGVVVPEGVCGVGTSCGLLYCIRVWYGLGVVSPTVFGNCGLAAAALTVRKGGY